ncbi:nuclear transport factor 2 family protein [Streptomyces spinosirectus]
MPDTPRAASVRLQQFYARQVHAVNAADFAAYRDTFIPDAEFTGSGLPDPVRGAGAIAEHSRRLHERRAAQEVVQRHHVTMTALLDRTDGVLAARSCTVIVATALWGRPVIVAGVECVDEFTETDGVLRVRRRRLHPLAS